MAKTKRKAILTTDMPAAASPFGSVEARALASVCDLVEDEDVMEPARVTACIKLLDTLNNPCCPDRLRTALSLQEKKAIDVLSDIAEGGLVDAARSNAVGYLLRRIRENVDQFWPPDTTTPQWHERWAKMVAMCGEPAEMPPNLSPFSTPAHLMAFYHGSFQSGEHSVYKWERDVLESFARWKPGGKAKKISVRAANGSGKSKMLLAPAVAWLSVAFPEALSVITSASLRQLKDMTLRGLKGLATEMNKFHGAELWDISDLHLKFRPTGANVEGRVTDEAERMEGFHPENPGRVFGIFIDEAKGITPEIFTGIRRWTGSTHKMECSSPGQPAGDFFQNHTSGEYEAFHVTVKDCPHVGEDEIRDIINAYGENSPFTRSALWAEFTSLDGDLVITLDKVKECLRMAAEGAIRHFEEPFNRAGVDFSGGGDEMVVSVWNGNKQLAIESVPFSEPTAAVDYMVKTIFPRWKLSPDNIWADAGGLGRVYVSMLRKLDYPVKSILAQKAAIGPSKNNWGNQGTENWWRVARLIEDCKLIPLPDKRQMDQLANRYHRRHLQSDRVILEPKPEAKAKGHPSPDRADAAVMALCRLNMPTEGVATPAKKAGYTMEELIKEWESRRLESGQVQIGSVTMRRALECHSNLEKVKTT